MKLLQLLTLFAAFTTPLPANEYTTTKELGSQLDDLARKHRKLARKELFQKPDVWLLELGTGNAEERLRRPALLAVAGIEGDDLLGTAVLTGWAAKILADANTAELLTRITIYVIPRLNTEAADAMFSQPKFAPTTNLRPVDDDHDGIVDEDGPDDLNRDGLIASMRVEDPEGEYILDPADPRLMLKADRAKGEVGTWRFLPEGRDNDADHAWNEDPPGGVNFNRNFPYNYKYFASTAGMYPMSEPPTRALAEFVVAHPNIAIAFTFGAADNLSATPKADAQGASRRPPTAMQEEDITWYRELGKLWRESIGLKKELSTASEPGTFSDWIYFHRGRLSLATRAWTPAMQMELSKPRNEKEAKEEKKEEAKGDKRNEEERAFLSWLRENSPESFVEWTRFDHPDFPGKRVEIGGFAPSAKINPPEKVVGELVEKHGKFLNELLKKFPQIALRKTEVKALGNEVYDITLHIENTGYLPTVLSQGTATREVRPTRVVLDLPDTAVLSGTRITTLPPLPGSGGMREVRYIVHAKGKSEIGVEIISALAGALRTNISLK